MSLRRRLDRWQMRARSGGPLHRYRALIEILDRFVFSTGATTVAAPHVRDGNNVQRLFNTFIIATLPCWLIGLWNVGLQTSLEMAELGLATLPGWRGEVLEAIGVDYDAGSLIDCFTIGLLYFLPIFVVTLVVATFWDVVFSTVRRRSLDEGMLATVWLFALIMPANAPLLRVAFGITFGYVVGKAIYGGSGRYLVCPALLGFVFLLFAYPDLMFGETAWIPVPGVERTPPVELAAAGGIEAVLREGYSLWDLFIGQRPGAIGTPSVLGCLLGAVYLVFSGAASWRIMLGALAGMIGTVLLFNGIASDGDVLFEIPWTWHLVIGGFAFGVVFFATDPVTAAMTNPGRWFYGALVGVLTIVIRVTNPSYNEGVLFAVLLASLFSPVIDFVFVEMNARRRRRRLAEDRA
ncbi:MAG: NADH:ubiquinone reductase (Na(+)-transporting) subunit B [Gammaproteobacteria bacterium]